MRAVTFALLFILSLAAAKAVHPEACAPDIGDACPAPMSLASLIS